MASSLIRGEVQQREEIATRAAYYGWVHEHGDGEDCEFNLDVTVRNIRDWVRAYFLEDDDPTKRLRRSDTMPDGVPGEYRSLAYDNLTQTSAGVQYAREGAAEVGE